MANYPKEIAIQVEELLRNSGYVLKHLSFTEVVGMRVATYDFGDGEHIESTDLASGTTVLDVKPLTAKASR